MIEVKAFYKKHYTKTKGAVITFDELIVVGHANDGELNSIKCCASVTAILYGFTKVVTGATDIVKMEKGYFHYKNFNSTGDKNTRCSLDLVIIQLYEVYKTYPNLFKTFDMIEKGGN